MSDKIRTVGVPNAEFDERYELFRRYFYRNVEGLALRYDLDPEDVFADTWLAYFEKIQPGIDGSRTAVEANAFVSVSFNLIMRSVAADAALMAGFQVGRRRRQMAERVQNVLNEMGLDLEDAQNNVDAILERCNELPGGGLRAKSERLSSAGLKSLVELLSLRMVTNEQVLDLIEVETGEEFNLNGIQPDEIGFLIEKLNLSDKERAAAKLFMAEPGDVLELTVDQRLFGRLQAKPDFFEILPESRLELADKRVCVKFKVIQEFGRTFLGEIVGRIQGNLTFFFEHKLRELLTQSN